MGAVFATLRSIEPSVISGMGRSEYLIANMSLSYIAYFWDTDSAHMNLMRFFAQKTGEFVR